MRKFLKAVGLMLVLALIWSVTSVVSEWRVEVEAQSAGCPNPNPNTLVWTSLTGPSFRGNDTAPSVNCPLPTGALNQAFTTLANALTAANTQIASALASITTINGNITTIDNTLAGLNLHFTGRVGTNAALTALNSTAFTRVLRGGFSTEGDGGAAWYVPSTSACTLNSGAGDNGSQVKSSDNKCWIADFRGAPANVQVWGGCLGGADDTTAINAALASSNKVSLPAKTCTIAGTLNISDQQSELMGAGRGQTVLQTSSATLDLLSVSASYASIHDLTFNSKTARTAGCFVNLLGMATAPRIYNFSAFSSFRGVCYNGPNSAVVHNGDIRNTVAGGDGIYVNGCFACTLGPEIVMDNSPSSQPEANVRIDAAGDFTLLNVHGLHGGDCLLVDPTVGNNVQSLRITNSWNDTCGQHAAWFKAQGGNIQRVDVVQSWFATAQLEGVKMSTSAGGSINGIAFVEPHIVNNGLSAGADQFVAADSGVANVEVIGGYIANNANSIGMHFGTGVSGFTIKQVKAGPFGGFSNLLRALQIDSSATNFVVAGNDFSGNVGDTIITPTLDGIAAIYHDNVGSRQTSPVALIETATQWWSVDGNSSVTTLNHGTTITLPAGGGLLLISNDSNGDFAVFAMGGGIVNLISSTKGTFVMSGSPPAGDIGVAFDSGATYKIVSNFGSNVDIRIVSFRTRAGG